jgi:hypothetical protein
VRAATAQHASTCLLLAATVLRHDGSAHFGGNLSHGCEVRLVARLVGSATHSIRHLRLARPTHLNGRTTYSTMHADRSTAGWLSTKNFPARAARAPTGYHTAMQYCTALGACAGKADRISALHIYTPSRQACLRLQREFCSRCHVHASPACVAPCTPCAFRRSAYCGSDQSPAPSAHTQQQSSCRCITRGGAKCWPKRVCWCRLSSYSSPTTSNSLKPNIRLPLAESVLSVAVS